MKGKIGIVVGLGVGYVLGSRAGRERYEQIKTQWLKVWHLDPVQTQVTKAKTFAKAQAAVVPQALWNGAVKVVKAASADGSAQQRVDATVATAKEALDEVKDVAEDAAETARAAASKAKKPAPKQSPRKEA